jgi:solute carrier family 12 sodium/potassium/chloride transporter 2
MLEGMTNDPPPVALHEQLALREDSKVHRFGTFQGVFTPVLLTILGVIMFLRLGWVVGHAGLIGAIAVIVIATAITTFTALSMSTITTNIRIGSGGAFSIISQSLGLEVGGSVGIPLYLCQAFAVAMYIFGFREGWLTIFPDHSSLLIDLSTFVILMTIALVSADLAFRVQYFLLAILALSLLSVFGGIFKAPDLLQPQLLGSFSEAPPWMVFAVFFPAVTGIMAGLNMSGELTEPRESIPKGTLWGIAVSSLVYLVLAVWCSIIASPQELTTNYTIMVDKAYWAPAVVAGLLGATFSSGLTSLVGAPRILQALGQHSVVPGSRWFSLQSRSGEPRNALLFTGAIVLVALLLRQLNVIAPLITMFFLIAYGMLNLVTLLEQRLGLASFRPLLRIHPVIPFLGALGCVLTMFVVNPFFSLLAGVVVLSTYIALYSGKLSSPHGDLRSGLFVSLAQWAAAKVAGLPGSERAWRPILLVPVSSTAEIRGEYTFLRDLAEGQGTIQIVGLATEANESELKTRLAEVVESFRADGIYTTYTLVDAEDPASGTTAAFQALQSAFFRPNILFVRLPKNEAGDRAWEETIFKARRSGLGVLLFYEHPESALGCERTINVWVRDQTPNWSLSMNLGNKDMSLLTAYLLNCSWQGKVRLLCTVADESNSGRRCELSAPTLTAGSLKGSRGSGQLRQLPRASEERSGSRPEYLRVT